MRWFAALRTLLFFVGYATAIMVFSLLGLTVGLLLPNRARQRLLTTGNAVIIRWFSLICGVRLVVRGRENIPTTPFVALSNHQSAWETFYLQRLFCPVSTILKRELLRIPFFGWGLALTNPIAIDRSNPRDAMRQVMEQGQQRLESGNNVLIYPEGTRMPFGQSGKYARSGAGLALKTGVPVIPVAHNAGLCWRNDDWVKFPGTIHVVIGAPLTTAERDSRQVTEAAQQWIETKLAELPGSGKQSPAVRPISKKL